MSSSFSANQYDGAFRSQRLQNWSGTKPFKQRPTAQVGHTSFIADDKGHLFPGKQKKGSAWPDFKGTWDLSDCIPSQRMNHSGLSVAGLTVLQSRGVYPRRSSESLPHRGGKSTDKLQDAGEQTSVDVQPDSPAETSAAESRPSSQNCPLTGSDRGEMQAVSHEHPMNGLLALQGQTGRFSASETAVPPGAARGAQSAIILQAQAPVGII